MSTDTQPFEIGDIVTVTKLAIRNDVGGTEIWSGEGASVLITKAWFDDEIGWCFRGSVQDAAIVEDLRSLGTTGFTPENYRKYEKAIPDIVSDTAAAREAFNPSNVFFGEEGIFQPATPRP